VKESTGGESFSRVSTAHCNTNLSLAPFVSAPHTATSNLPATGSTTGPAIQRSLAPPTATTITSPSYHSLASTNIRGHDPRMLPMLANILIHTTSKGHGFSAPGTEEGGDNPPNVCGCRFKGRPRRRQRRL
jgi:hypothetical protein